MLLKLQLKHQLLVVIMQSDLLLLDLREAEINYPGLKIVNEPGGIKLKGVLELLHPEYFVAYDTFNVELYFPEDFPYCFPKVIETDEKIERCANRHVNVQDNNTLCLTVEPEERLLCINGISTTKFINCVLLPRLCEEHEVNNGGKYSHEFDHKEIGYWQYYERKLGVSDKDTILTILQQLIDHNLPKGFNLCYCGSGEKFKNCHRDFLYIFNKLGTRYIKFQINLLNKYK